MVRDTLRTEILFLMIWISTSCVLSGNEPMRATIVAEFDISSILSLCNQRELKLEKVIAVSTPPDGSSPGPSPLESITNIEVGGYVGMLTGNSNELIVQLSFQDVSAANKLIQMVQPKGSISSQAGRGAVTQIDGLPPLFVESKDSTTVCIGSQLAFDSDAGVLLELSRAPQWKALHEGWARIGINLNSIRASLVPIVESSTMDSNVKNEIVQWLSGCESVFVLLSDEEPAAVHVVMVAAASSTTKRLKKRVDGILFLLRSWVESTLSEFGTGDDSTDSAISELAESLESEINGNEVHVSIAPSEELSKTIDWLIRLINRSTESNATVE